MTPPPPKRTARARAAYDRAYARLIEAIRADLADGSTVMGVVHATDWSREYIGQIRDGKAGDAGPRRGSNRKHHDPASRAANPSPEH